MTGIPASIAAGIIIGEVTLDSCDIGKGYACAEVVGTRVAGSCIAGDHVRVALHALLKRLLGETVSQDR